MLGMVINNMNARGPLRTSLVLVGISFSAYILGLAIGCYRELYGLAHFDYDAPLSLGRQTLKKLLTLSVGQHRRQHSDVVQTTILKGEQAIHALAYVILSDLAPLTLHVVPTLVALIWFNHWLGIAVTVGVASFVCTTLLMGHKFHQPLASVRDLSVAHNKLQAEILRNMSVIQLNAQDALADEEYTASAETHANLAKSTWRRFIICGYLDIGQLGLIRFIVLLAAVYYVGKGSYSTGSLVVFVLWTENAISGLHRISYIQRRLAGLWPEIQSYLALRDTKPDIVQSPKPIRPAGYAGAVEFRNVSFAYPKTANGAVRPGTTVSEEADGAAPRYAIKDLTFAIAPGEKVGFVGFSGAGKSTVIALLLRAYDPASGQILIDGHDLRDLDLTHYRQSVGVVEQSVLLFDNTIRYNVLCSVPKHIRMSEQQLEETLSTARVNDFSSRLPRGLDTRVGERGVSLSGGECQRISIARALVKRPSIVIFDEATSHLDAINESMIMDRIERAAGGRTTIVIAHRVATVSRLDRIFVLDHGRIVGMGPHEQLINECGIYRELVTKQSITSAGAALEAAVS